MNYDTYFYLIICCFTTFRHVGLLSVKIGRTYQMSRANGMDWYGTVPLLECYRFCKLATDRRALLTGLFLTPQKEKLPAHRSFWVPRNWQPFYVDATNANDQFCWSYAYPSIPTVLVCRILQVRWFLVLPKNTWWLYVAMLPFLVCDSCCW